MKLITLFIALSFAAFSQTYNVCVQLVATPAKQTCTLVTAPEQTAVNSFLLVEGTTVNGVFTPKYLSTTDLVFQQVHAMFTSLVARFPTGAHATAVNEKAAAEATIATEQAKAAPKPPPVQDPK